MNDSKLPTPLGSWVDERPPARSREMWRVIDHVRAQRRASREGFRYKRTALLAFTACAAVVVTLAMSWSVRPSVEGALLRLDRRALPTRMEPIHTFQALDLSDGSRITAAQGSRLDLLASSGRSFSLALRQGRVRFDVRPHGPRAWRIDCGAVTVEVIGTAFTIERVRDRVRVRVMRGAVLVRGVDVPDGVQRLNPGQALSVQPHDEASAQAPLPTQAASNGPRAVRASRAMVRMPSRAIPRVDQATVLDTQIDKALDLLWREADAARGRGAVQDAVAPLEALVARETDRTRAALAAFTLAKLRLGTLDEPQRAAADLRLALGLGLREPLAEEARARLVEALSRTGDGAAACAAVQTYRTMYPQGLHNTMLQRDCGPASVPH